jgi:hypothetical protein
MKAKLKILQTTGMLLISTMTLITACKKDSSSSSTSTADNNSATTLSANGASSDNMFDDALNVTLQTDQDQSLNNYILQKSSVATNGMNGSGSTVTGAYYCATVTVSPADTVSFPKTITVDFGNGCTSLDNITRSGSISYTLSARFSNPGSTISATFNNYVVNGYKLTGTYSITNNSSIANGVVYTTKVTDGSITYPSDTSYSFSGTKTVTQTAGIGSLDFSTYVFSVSGGYTISNSFGESLTANVTTPLVKEETCPNIVSGILDFTYTKGNIKLNGTFDYGSGTCDKIATVTIGNSTSTVNLP